MGASVGSLNCICLKYGSLYGPEYVNRLYAALVRNSHRDVRLLCMTDDPSGIDPKVEILPLPEEPFAPRMVEAMRTAKKNGKLKKISLFRPDLIGDLDGPLLVLDLDVAITGSVDELFDYAPGKVCMRRVWLTNAPVVALGHGSVERFDPRLHGYIYDFMATDPEGGVALGEGSEQAYTSRIAAKHGDLVHYPDEWIVSFKYQCRPPRPLNMFLEPRLPPNARVVCFHGRPKMDEAVDGYRANPLHMTRPCGWLRKSWIG